MDLTWEALKLRVCRHCVDGNEHGDCSLPAGEECALRSFHGEVVETVRAVTSRSYDDYVKALRARVCSRCPEQWPNGECGKRNRLECALDRYFPNVMEAIQSVKAFNRQSA